MWARGYFACNTGNVSTEMIAAYIEGHTAEDSFKGVDDFESCFSFLEPPLSRLQSERHFQCRSRSTCFN